MPPSLRTAVLVAHTTGSVGLLGAIGSFLALAIKAVSSGDALAVRGAYLSMQAVTLTIIVPLAFIALLSGLVLALGTRWGLVRHWWVVVKLLLTSFAVVVLLVKLGLIRRAAMLAGQAPLPGDALRDMGWQLVVHAAGGFLTLFLPVLLSIYKPRGLTRYGLRTIGNRPADSEQ